MLARRYAFTRKAREEMRADGLTEVDVVESILNAAAIAKTIRSTSPFRRNQREYLHVIVSPNLSGTVIYTKGKMVKEARTEHFYVLISSKRAV